MSSCATYKTLNYPPKAWLIDHDRAPISEPKPKWAFGYADDSDVRILYEMEKVIEATTGRVSRPTELLVSNKLEAMNTSNFDEVPDSTWFTNRIGRYGLDLKTIVTGPNTGSGPIKGPLRIINANPAERPAVIIVEDSQGVSYELTFDLPGHPEMETSAAMIATLILHATGYNVPEGYIIDLDSSSLVLDANSTANRRLFGGNAMTQKHLTEALAYVDKSRGAKHIRAFAEKIPEGKDVGPFLFRGKRSDDKNDRIPHEHRRELRGFCVFSAFLDHVMAFDSHTRDHFAADPDGNGYLKHYIRRFEDSLGSERAEEDPKLQLMSDKDIFDAEHFNPGSWSSALPNIAFDNMTYLDAFWASKILLHFTDNAITAIVDSAKISDPAVSKYLKDTLIARRDKTVAYWFAKTPPLDRFSITQENDGLTVTFDNLAIEAELEKENEARYRWRLRGSMGRVVLSPTQETNDRILKIGRDTLLRMKSGKIYMLELQSLHPRGGEWSTTVDLFIKKDAAANATLMGIERRYNHYPL